MHSHAWWISVFINPRCMHEGYDSCAVCLCVSVTALAGTYLVYKSKVRCYKVPYGVSNLCIVWISLKTLCSPVLASFAYNRCPPRSLRSS